MKTFRIDDERQKRKEKSKIFNKLTGCKLQHLIFRECISKRRDVLTAYYNLVCMVNKPYMKKHQNIIKTLSIAHQLISNLKSM